LDEYLVGNLFTMQEMWEKFIHSLQEPPECQVSISLTYIITWPC